MKKCTTCKDEKEIEEFIKSSKDPDKISTKCRTCRKEATKEWRKNNKNQCSQYKKDYRSSFPDRNVAYTKKHRKTYYENNKAAIKAVNNAYCKGRMRTDLDYRLRFNLRARVRSAIKSNTKSKGTLSLIGCTIDELKKHLESKFTPEMNWENYGIFGWHIDHKKPCKLFDLTIAEQQQECFHYSNLQPLWCTDNLRKNGNYKLSEN